MVILLLLRKYNIVKSTNMDYLQPRVFLKELLWPHGAERFELLKKLRSKFSTNYALQLYPGFYIAETNTKELDAADFINHSCEPNCKIVNLLIMITKRKIGVGEELTADFDEGSPKIGRRTKCLCGSVHCRKIVYF